jgi:protein-glutamine gamma-glutamyltransferase
MKAFPSGWILSNNRVRSQILVHPMPPPTQPAAALSLAPAIHRYFELSLYLLVLMGFGALAATGGLDLPAMILVGSALAFRGYLLARRRSIAIADRWSTPLTIAYFLFYAADFFLLSRSFLTATVHLVLFAVVVRTFSLRRDRDFAMLAILAFLMLLASAVLTVDSVFLVFFAGFMLTAVATFILMEMRQSGKNAKFRARHSPDAYEHRHLAFSLARVTSALVLLIMVGATAMFFLLPRMSAGYLGNYSFGNDFSAGFSDRVQLGRIGQIQQSNAVAMHIQIDGDTQGRYDLHWRGMALANFDGHTWSNYGQRAGLQREPSGGFAVPRLNEGATKQAEQAGNQSTAATAAELIHYRVVMEPIGTSVFFLAPWARRVRGSYRALQIDASGGVYDSDGERPPSIYDAVSDISTPAPAQLREAGDFLPQFAFTYLRVPPLDPRIPRLAQQISGSATNNYDKASAIESYLKTHFGYTLQLPRSPVGDPLANFLFERKQGHCEYFASAMAVMLRTQRIPARVVNGFRGGEFNDLTGSYVVRARDAHAWVEAYFPGYGWVTFDPTPAGVSGTSQGWSRLLLYLDAASSFWREWVISYDSSHQYVLGQAAVSRTRASWEKAQSWVHRHYARMETWASRSERKVDLSAGRWLGIAASVLVLLVLLANAAWIVRTIRARRLLTHPERSPDEAAAMWYERMAHLLERRGVQKSTSQTAQEFVRIIPEERLRTRVGEFTLAYEAARFGNSAEDARRLPELYEEVEMAGRG